MCGVFGYIGNKDPLEICLAGLQQLEYRGYDSTGIGGIYQGKIELCKRAGKLSVLRKTINLPRLDLAIAHTRWATHGGVNDENAHPHLDASGAIALIHNGIIENYKELRDDLIKDGVLFLSETDSEVVANLIAKYYKGDMVQALHQAISHLKGIFSFLVIHKDHPDEMIATARDCPLSVGYNDAGNEAMISSDPNTFQGSGYNICFLRDDEIARVKQGKIEIFNRELVSLIKKTERLEIDATPPSKEGFEHFMLKEIFEQPRTLQKALLGRYDDGVFFEELKLNPEFFKKIRQLWILGCGTSAHAGLITSILMEDLARFPATVEIASEARYRNPLLSPETLILAISQSGETADTLAALRETKKYGCKTLGICNVKNSTLSREADAMIFLKAGPEMSVCSTKAFTSQLAVLTLLSLYFAQINKSLSKEAIKDFFEDLQKIPAQIQNILDRADQIQKIAKKYAAFSNFFFLGRRYMYPTCMEAALKLKEISYVNANGYPAGELKHGPIALLDADFPVIAFCANDKTRDKIGSNLTEVKARRAPIFAIAPESFHELESIADDIFYVPNTRDELAPFTSSVVGQLFAYYIAKERGCDIDQPRNLAKSVTVE